MDCDIGQFDELIDDTLMDARNIASKAELEMQVFLSYCDTTILAVMYLIFKFIGKSCYESISKFRFRWKWGYHVR